MDQSGESRPLQRMIPRNITVVMIAGNLDHARRTSRLYKNSLLHGTTACDVLVQAVSGALF